MRLGHRHSRVHRQPEPQQHDAEYDAQGKKDAPGDIKLVQIALLPPASRALLGAGHILEDHKLDKT